jgi:hypothetical protein
MRDNSAVADDQPGLTSRSRRGRPRKWSSEAARREHEAAKRRVRNKTNMTPDEFDDVVRLTALADGLQRQVDVAAKELEQLRQRTRDLEHGLAQATRRSGANAQASVPSSPPVMNRQQRREAERAQRRVDGQPRRTPPTP